MQFEYTVQITVEVKFQSDSKVPEIGTRFDELLGLAAQIVWEAAPTITSPTGKESAPLSSPEGDERVVEATLLWAITLTPEATNSSDQDEPGGDE